MARLVGISEAAIASENPLLAHPALLILGSLGGSALGINAGARIGRYLSSNPERAKRFAEKTIARYDKRLEKKNKKALKKKSNFFEDDNSVTSIINSYLEAVVY